MFKSVIDTTGEWDGVIVLGIPTRPILIFAGKARNLSKSGAPERYFTREGSGLTHKHYHKVEHSDWFVRGIINEEKKFYNIGRHFRNFTCLF